jgi:transcriptional regulator with XRE-family HTH domain
LANILAQMNPYSLSKYPSDVLLELAQKAKKLRKSKKMSQVDLSKRANLSLGSLKRFEQTGQISLESLLKISFILGRLEEFELLFKRNEMEEIEKLFKEDI